jgi:hypothetical protein
MNMLVNAAVLTILAVAPAAHAQSGTGPEGTLRPGSLGNAKLIRDTKVGVAQKVALLGCDKPETLEPYVVAMPTGEVGARRWKERWIVGGCGKKYPVNIDFSEDGPNAAHWTIPGR